MGHNLVKFDLAEAESGRYSFQVEVSLDAKEWTTFMTGTSLREA